ncbi:hypothetical protein ACFL1L_00430 [Thermoplasmatota archaeon]
MNPTNEINIAKNERFFETVAQNRGHNVKIFTDLKKAQEWLL